ncbi:MAG: TIGR03086 family metal-binding protein [Actinomycetota bacterium]
MSENLRKYIKGVYMLDAVAQRVPSDAWNAPSCCEGWTAREAAGHAGWLIRNVGSLAAGKGSIAEQAEADVLGDDPASGVREIVTTTLAALDQPGAIQTVADTPFGTMPIDRFLGIVWVDPMIHAWDVADATGIDHGIDQASAAAAHAKLSPVLDNLRGPGMFGDEQAVGGDDAVAALMAFTGRSSVHP